MSIMTFTKFLNEGVGNFEIKKLARELYSVIKKVQGCDYIEIVTSDIKSFIPP